MADSILRVTTCQDMADLAERKQISVDVRILHDMLCSHQNERITSAAHLRILLEEQALLDSTAIQEPLASIGTALEGLRLPAHVLPPAPEEAQDGTPAPSDTIAVSVCRSLYIAACVILATLQVRIRHLCKDVLESLASSHSLCRVSESPVERLSSVIRAVLRLSWKDGVVARRIRASMLRLDIRLRVYARQNSPRTRWCMLFAAICGAAAVIGTLAVFFGLYNGVRPND